MFPWCGSALFAVYLILFPGIAGAQPAMLDPSASDYLAELKRQARALGLWQRREWHKLLHYKPKLLLPGVRSLNDDPAFFNAPDGKRNPQAELDATLGSFFGPLDETDKIQPAQCRFIARYHWLKHELDFNSARLPPAPCRRFSDWRASLKPEGVTLVFPAAYLNNPASMYGHTLLRIDGKDQDERTRLLAYAVNYAAKTDETSGLIFAVKGLLGSYPGGFSSAPYYLKVREYSDLENRDIWEYRLDFTPEEIERLLMHLWELGPTYFDYYFLDENCSYHLLALLEAARPELSLTDRFRWWAIPSDTVAVVTEQPGLLKEAVYRPAAGTVLRHHLDLLPPPQRGLVRRLADREMQLDDPALAELPPQTQAAILEAAYEYAVYRRITDNNESEQIKMHLRQLLLARSQVAAASPAPPVPRPAVRPDQGHGSARLMFGAGRDDGKTVQELRLRPAYHDLLDAEPGFNRGAQIEFFALVLRHEQGSDGVRLQDFRPIDIFSLAGRDDFFRPLSWKINVGWTRVRLADGRRPLVARLNGGSGLAWEINSPRDNSLLFVMLEGTLDLDNRFEDNYALGAGPSFGWLYDVTPAWRIFLQARYQRFGLGDVHTNNDLILSQRYTLTRNNALRFDLARRSEFGHYGNSAVVYWMAYF